MKDLKKKANQEFIINGIKYGENDKIPDLHFEFDNNNKEEVLTLEVLKDLELLD